ncbi:hypothetical protein HNQ94_000813 [Salirhabdus euzebyi]|uniref:Pyridoxamine 5'-phosphate oxidase N-terminal domain-containing protein n=1 Tax=Salirhabdus euzebyi TaxID=394506 RepID=A0A841Q329_9BACI|nr:pyridoxamine 5'-phosphate oxidase family protein [Salirhabdus euzebyi]MBB6452368.1 hypothetical protein [Salirhabdus euzebyi]
MSKIKETIKSEDELREILGTPSKLVENKVITYLDGNCIEFLAKSPFLVMSTANENGACDASPRGDAPGFVHVLDEKHLVIPERPGNKRIDSMRNILTNPSVGLIFIIPGLEETLRINGRAEIIKDEELLQKMEAQGKIPLLGICVEVEECFIHCAKAFKRSKLWDPESWTNQKNLPSPAKILSEHAKIPNQEVQKLLQESYTKRLY